MSVRLPYSLSRLSGRDAAFDLIQHEVIAEKAASLGRAGRVVEQRMAELAAARGDRTVALQRAADAVFAFIVQRELCGLRGSEEALHSYGVRPEVMARVGVCA